MCSMINVEYVKVKFFNLIIFIYCIEFMIPLLLSTIKLWKMLLIKFVLML